MKPNIALCLALSLAACTSDAAVFEQQQGYVCSVSADPQLAGPSGNGALDFTLSSEPDCGGTLLPINYVCPPDALVGPFTGDFCSATVRFGVVDMSRLHDQLLLALEKDLLVHLGREDCVRDRNDRGCFFGASIWQPPSSKASSPVADADGSMPRERQAIRAR